jgi:hypothetical protein
MWVGKFGTGETHKCTTCSKSFSIEPEQAAPAPEDSPTKTGLRSSRPLEKLSNYTSNIALVAAMQSIGRSTKAATTVCGCLCITANTFNSRWTVVERVIGESEINVKNEILKESRALESMGKTKLENGKYPDEASADMGWLGKASKRNSMAGLGHLIS